MSLKSEVSLNPRHKKRRPRTSFFVDLVEPGTFELASNVPVFIGCYVPLLLKAYTGAYMLLASAVVVPV